MQTKKEYILSIATKGGRARWNKMTQEEREKAIRKMVDARTTKRNAAISEHEVITK